MPLYVIIDLISLEQITWGLLQKPKRIICTLGTNKAGKKPKLGQQGGGTFSGTGRVIESRSSGWQKNRKKKLFVGTFRIIIGFSNLIQKKDKLCFSHFSYFLHLCFWAVPQRTEFEKVPWVLH